MILLSKVIKQAVSNHKRTLSLQKIEWNVAEDHLYEESIDEIPDAKSAEILIAEAKAEAERITAEARAELEKERQAWSSEKEKLIQSARQEGYDCGLELGKKEAENKYSSLIEKANKISDAARADYEEKLEGAQEEIINLAVALAKKVWNQKEDDQEEFQSLVSQVINELKDYENISIFIDAKYVKYVYELKQELIQCLPHHCHLNIYADTEASKGTCYIETDFGRIDASIDTQLNELKAKLLELIQVGREY
ncbi:flagellar assembly protein FliH [Bacillus gobiensis]|uniref:flagellar assembly protein FliH n=1 Tax=Bacillus gobiensis TaxID=1441095 RepID=UPI003D1D2F4C